MDKLPQLPDGMHYEPHAHEAHVVHVVRPDHGAVSIHWKRRTLAPGWTIPHPDHRSAEVRGGRGWREGLVAEAVSILMAV